MERKINDGDFAVSLYVTDQGVMDFKILAKDQAGFKKAKPFCAMLKTHLANFEKELAGSDVTEA